jgi:hypothetical protein
MNKSEKIIVRTVAFLVSMAISASAFGLLSSWAWTHLDPAQQETIGAINAPWIAAQRDQAAVPIEARTFVRKQDPKDGPVTTAVKPAR